MGNIAKGKSTGFGVRTEFKPGSSRCKLCGPGLVGSPLWASDSSSIKWELCYLPLSVSRKIKWEVHRSAHYRAWHTVYAESRTIILFMTITTSQYFWVPKSVVIQKIEQMWLADFNPTTWELCNLGRITYPPSPRFLTLKPDCWGFPGGTVVRNPPANAGDTGSIPGPGRSHMLWSG